MKNILNKKHTVTCLQVIIITLMSSITFTIILYLFLGQLNESIINGMQSWTTFQTIKLFFPLIFSVNFAINLSLVMIKHK